MQSSWPIVGLDDNGIAVIEAYGAQWPIMSDIALELACYRTNRKKEDGGLGAPRHLLNAHMLIWPQLNPSINEWMLKRIDAFCERHTILGLAGGAGTAKAEEINRKILTPQGWITMGDTKIGDEICTPDGKTAKIIAVHPQGIKDLYKIEFNDKTYTLVTEDHLWLTTTEQERKHNKIGKIRTTGQIQKTLYTRNGARINHFIPITNAVYGELKNLPIPPYLLGVFLGDGCSCAKHTLQLTINKKDLDIIEKIEKYWSLGIIKYNTKKIGSDTFCVKGINKKIKELHLNNRKSINKFIPKQYLFASQENRYQLFLGLMDTDGTHSGVGSVCYSTSSKQLSKDMASLARSLGLTVKIKSSIPTYTYKEKKEKGHRSYRLTIHIPKDFIPFSCKRKLLNFIPRQGKYKLKKQIVNISYYGKGEAKCITIDNPNGLYITDDYIVTHNSCDMARIALLHWWSLPTENTVLVCSTTIKALTQRIWSYITEYKESAAVDMPGKISNTPSPKMVFSNADPKHGIHGAALKEGASERTLADLIGIHPKNSLVTVVDEATDVTPAIIDAVSNWKRGGHAFQMVVIGNSKSKLDTHGQICEPLKGWESIDPDISTEWETKWGKCLYFDCYKSPAIARPNDPALKFLMTTEQIQEEIEKVGANDPKFWRFIRGFWAPDDITKTVMSLTLLETHKAFKPIEFSGDWIEVIAALDPAFTSEGDEAILRFARVGPMTNGLIGIDLGGKENIVSIGLSVNDPDPINYQLVKKTKNMCLQRGVKPQYLGVDTWGFGSGAGDIFEKLWSKDVHRVVSVGSATDSFINSDMAEKAYEQYDRRVTELWFMIREFVQAGQIRNLDKETAKELVTRTYEWKGRRISIESKEIYKRRTGAEGTPYGSPDRADALAILIDVVRFQMGITPNSREALYIDDKRDWEHTWEQQMGFIGASKELTWEDKWQDNPILESDMFCD